MANVGPIRIFSQLSGFNTLPELTRFLSAFTTEVASQFNNLLSNRLMAGAVSATGTVVSGENFGASMISLGLYYVKFNQPYSARPAVIVSSESTSFAWGSSLAVGGFFVNSGANTAFSFIARGEN